MVFVSDRQRKAVMAKLRAGKFIVEPTIIKLSPQQQAFIRKKVSKNIKEGKPPKQAVAISFSQARKKFGNGRLLPPSQKRDIKKIQRIIPKLTKKESEELRKIVAKKLKFSVSSRKFPKERFFTTKKQAKEEMMRQMRAGASSVAISENPGNPNGTSKIPLINLIPLLIGTFVILSILKAAQTIITKRKKR